MTSDQPVSQTQTQPLETEVHSLTRAPYTRPTLEAHGAFLVVTGCSLSAGCLPINDLGASENQGG